MNISREEVIKISKLAKLELSEDEIDSITNEFSSILDYVSQVNECDTTGIEFQHNLSDYNGDILQDDTPRTDESMYGKKLISTATEGREQNGYIRTSKMIDKTATD